MDEEATSPSRRELLKRSGAILGVGGVVPRSVVGRSNVRTVTLPRIKKSPDEVVEFHELPAKWWNHTRRVKRVAKAFRSRWGSRPGVESIGVTSREDDRKAFDYRSPKLIEVEVTEEAVADALPDELEGVPVRSTVVPGHELMGICKNTEALDPTPGGLFASPSEITGGAGTTGYAARYNGTDVLVTCHHIWNNNCDRDLAAEGLGLDIGTNPEYFENPFGHVTVSDKMLDTVFVEPDDGHSVFGGIHEPELGSRDVIGYHHESSVLAVEDDGETVYKVGTATGKELGRVNATYVTSSGGCHAWDDGISTTCNAANGDSGGPIYTINGSGEAELLGHATERSGCSWFTSCSEDCSGDEIGPGSNGPSVYEVAEWHDITVI